MADLSYSNQGVYRKQGGLQFVIASGASIKVESGGSILPNSGTKAATIADFASSANMSSAQVAKLNALLLALENVGILATS